MDNDTQLALTVFLTGPLVIALVLIVMFVPNGGILIVIVIGILFVALGFLFFFNKSVSLV